MMKIGKRTLPLTALVLALAVPGASKADMSDIDILAAADAKRGDVHGATWNLGVAEQGGEKSQLFVQARNQNFVAEYQAPSEQKGQKILERGQNMWFISPGASRPVPISPRQKLLGAASYGDIAAQRWSTEYKTVGRHETVEDGSPAYQLDLVADSDFATYDALTLFIDKETLAVVRSEMRAANGDLLKTATYKYDNQVPGRHGPDSMFISEMAIDSNGTKTTLSYGDVSFKALSPSNFQLANVMAN